MNKGLTSKEIKQFNDLLTKANLDQLKGLDKLIKNKLNKVN